MHKPDGLLIFSLSQPAGATGSRISSASWCLVAFCLLVVSPTDGWAKTKTPRAPRPEPELKILDLKVAPVPYNMADGSLEFTALVQLPRELQGASLLEVSSFVTSPSKTSIRFLSMRKALEPHTIPTATAEDRPRLSVVLKWDGMDHKKTPAGPGQYQYELRAKLLANGEKGPRTLMVSWPKRGTLDVK